MYLPMIEYQKHDRQIAFVHKSLCFHLEPTLWQQKGEGLFRVKRGVKAPILGPWHG